MVLRPYRTPREPVTGLVRHPGPAVHANCRGSGVRLARVSRFAG